MLTSLVLASAVTVALPQPRTLLGTGFFYNSRGDFFTNRHVISKCRSGSIGARTADGVWHPVMVLAVANGFDIAAGSIQREVSAFASVRAFGNVVSVPEPTEDIFSAGFSAPTRNNFKLQTKWGQIQPWGNPNARPFVQRMRMDAYPGASGSAILDYSGLLVGIIFAGSKQAAPDVQNMRAAGYGDKWIFFYNNNAIVEFANSNNLSYSVWGEWRRRDPMFIARHAQEITVLIACEAESGS
jgi:S1-C subfamily serine protease